MRTFTNQELTRADLVVDAKYEGKRRGNAGDDPLPSLLGVSNQGGFRYIGTVDQPRLIVITSSLSDADWPDELDPVAGIFTYFGDNKKPGRALHDTPRFGNTLLKNIFDALHTNNRDKIPPILVFTNSGQWRDLIFRGLVVPGAIGLSQNDDLVAVWKISKGQRFQNYRARFTILDVPHIRREWIDEVRRGGTETSCSSEIWRKWIETGTYSPLRAARSIEIRSKNEQLPASHSDIKMLNRIYTYFSNDPFAFESCAAELVRLSLGNVANLDLTRPSRDGGRDAIGNYTIGFGESSITVEFAVEAKCYSSANSVGVKELSRLISRLRHRQFGVMVSTSWVHSQAYKEIREDSHPIIVISGSDIVDTLKRHGISSEDGLKLWLNNFPVANN